LEIRNTDRSHKDFESGQEWGIMSNSRLNGRCELFVDRILNADGNDRTRSETRSIRPEGLEKEGRFGTPCCDYLVQYIDRFKEEYDGHIGLAFVEDGDEYFEDFTNCPFCGAPISYTIRKSFRMVQEGSAGPWKKQEESTWD
jgi:hypothetical protein